MNEYRLTYSPDGTTFATREIEKSRRAFEARLADRHLVVDWRNPTGTLRPTWPVTRYPIIATYPDGECARERRHPGHCAGWSAEKWDGQ